MNGEAQSDPVVAFKSLNPEQQKAALGKMSLQAKQSLLTRLQDPKYKSVFSEEGKHPIVSKALGYIPAVTATAAGIAFSETGPGAVAAAGIGGAAGKMIEQGARKRLGFETKEGSESVSEIALEGGKQAAYELGGRAVGAVGGRALAKVRGVKPEVVGETIAGVKLPE